MAGSVSRLKIRSRVGVTSRTQLVQRCTQYLFAEISEVLPENATLKRLVESLPRLLGEPLVSSIQVYIYSERMIRARLTIDVDWDMHDGEIAFGVATFEDGGPEQEEIHTSVSGLVSVLKTAIAALGTRYRLDDVDVTWTFADAAIAKYGLEGALERSGGRLTPKAIWDHLRTFQVADGQVIQPQGLRELSAGYAEGTSSLRPSG